MHPMSRALLPNASRDRVKIIYLSNTPYYIEENSSGPQIPERRRIPDMHMLLLI